jgi:hypothetical protein
MKIGSGTETSGFHLLLQSGRKQDPDYPKVPLLSSLAETPDQKVVFDYFSAMGALARPVAVAEGVPPERVKVLRAAFVKAMQDPELLAEAKKQQLEIAVMDGAEVQEIVEGMVNAPASVLEKVRNAIQVKGAQQLKRGGTGKGKK